MRKRKTRHFHGEIPDDDFTLLLLDGDPDDLAEPFAEFAIEEAAPDLWAEMGDKLLAQWITHSPGCRPWPWWAFEAPGLRFQTGGDGRPAWRVENVVAAVAWGIPVRWRNGEAQFETQHAFLQRHDLLLPGEGPPIREPHPVPAGSWHYQVARPWGSGDAPAWPRA